MGGKKIPPQFCVWFVFGVWFGLGFFCEKECLNTSSHSIKTITTIPSLLISIVCSKTCKLSRRHSTSCKMLMIKDCWTALHRSLHDQLLDLRVLRDKLSAVLGCNFSALNFPVQEFDDDVCVMWLGISTQDLKESTDPLPFPLWQSKRGNGLLANPDLKIRKWIFQGWLSHFIQWLWKPYKMHILF